MSSINDDILHYQRKIEKYSSDAKVVLHCLNKLTKLPIGVQHLQVTGIGRTINGMRKADGAVGEEARALVQKWKEMVAAEDKSDSDVPADEDHHEEVNHSDKDEEDEAERHEVDVKSKHKDSYRDKSKEEVPSTSKSKSSSSKSKSSSSKSSKSSDKKKESKGKEGASSSSSKSRKRHHSEDGSASHEDDDTAGPTMSFEDALGSIESSSKKKKSKDKDKEKHKSDKKKTVSEAKDLLPNSSSMFPPEPSLPPPKCIEISPLDFGISPDYKPQPKPMNYASEGILGRNSTTEEALSAAMAQKGSRTKVFSGNRSSGLSYVPTLFECCIRVLQQNIDALEFTGGVPYELLRPVLERANPQQLYSLEHYNPYLLEDTDELWKVLCQKEFRKAVREEMETWRDLYLKCHEEREERLKNLTNSHKQSMAKATPVRTTKLAYVESVARAPRGKTGQIKQGVLASMTNAKSTARPFEASVSRPSNSNAAAEVVKMPPPPSSRSSSTSSSAPAAKKPKVAPLMQKTLKLMKNRFRR